MGSRIIELALADDALRIAGAFTRESSSAIGREIAIDKNTNIPLDKTAFSTTRECRSIIDFSSDDGARFSIEHAKKIRAALLIGTTALSVTTIQALKELSTLAPVLVASNTSLGVALLASSIARAARALGPEYRCSIVEAHHDKKKDAPSGTALHLAKAARDAGASLSDSNIVAIRSGDVVGEHTVRFAGPGEYLEFTHRATSRDVFARGAIHAIKWLAAQPAGWYTMRDMLGIDD
jgi:4-hydroxy-tetrahydrodipicolinate reductase